MLRVVEAFCKFLLHRRQCGALTPSVHSYDTAVQSLASLETELCAIGSRSIANACVKNCSWKARLRILTAAFCVRYTAGTSKSGGDNGHAGGVHPRIPVSRPAVLLDLYKCEGDFQGAKLAAVSAARSILPLLQCPTRKKQVALWMDKVSAGMCRDALRGADEIAAAAAETTPRAVRPLLRGELQSGYSGFVRAGEATNGRRFSAKSERRAVLDSSCGGMLDQGTERDLLCLVQ